MPEDLLILVRLRIIWLTHTLIEPLMVGT
jgi:hypothetical protein